MDKANWTPEEIVQLAKELNNYGTHYRNAVACLYNTFTYTLANYWRGANYNKVAEFVNEHYDEFNTITHSICVTIPSILQDIAMVQAKDGLGDVPMFNYEIYDPSGVDGAVSFNLIPMTEKSADGSIQLTEDVAKQYIDGNSEPSLPFYSERMEEYMNSYVSTLEQFSGVKEFNEALKSTFDTIGSFKVYSLDVSKDIIAEARLRADVELGKISDTDASSKDLAVRVLNGYEGDSANPSTSGTNYTPNKSSSTSGTNYTASKSSSTSGTNYTSNKSSSTSGTNYTSNKSSSTSGTNYTPSKSSSTSGTNYTPNKGSSTSESNNIKYDKPIGPEMPNEIKQKVESQKSSNAQVIQDYLNSDYEKGSNDNHVYTINGKEMYIDEIKDNGNSYTITYYDKADEANGFMDGPSTMDVSK